MVAPKNPEQQVTDAEEESHSSLKTHAPKSPKTSLPPTPADVLSELEALTLEIKNNQNHSREKLTEYQKKQKLVESAYTEEKIRLKTEIKTSQAAIDAQNHLIETFNRFKSQTLDGFTSVQFLIGPGTLKGLAEQFRLVNAEAKVSFQLSQEVVDSLHQSFTKIDLTPLQAKKNSPLAAFNAFLKKRSWGQWIRDLFTGREFQFKKYRRFLKSPAFLTPALSDAQFQKFSEKSAGKKATAWKAFSAKVAQDSAIYLKTYKQQAEGIFQAKSDELNQAIGPIQEAKGNIETEEKQLQVRMETYRAAIAAYETHVPPQVEDTTEKKKDKKKNDSDEESIASSKAEDKEQNRVSKFVSEVSEAADKFVHFLKDGPKRTFDKIRGANPELSSPSQETVAVPTAVEVPDDHAEQPTPEDVVTAALTIQPQVTPQADGAKKGAPAVAVDQQPAVKKKRFGWF